MSETKEIRVADTVYQYRIDGTTERYLGQRPATDTDPPYQDPLIGWNRVSLPNGNWIWTPPGI